MSSSDKLLDPVAKAVLIEFQPRFVPTGRVLWASDFENRVGRKAKNALALVGAWALPLYEIPNFVIWDDVRDWLILVDVVQIRGQINKGRRETLERIFRKEGRSLVFVNAFKSRLECRKQLTELTWQTTFWFAEEPNHLIRFNGACFLGPY